MRVVHVSFGWRKSRHMLRGYHRCSATRLCVIVSVIRWPPCMCLVVYCSQAVHVSHAAASAAEAGLAFCASACPNSSASASANTSASASARRVPIPVLAPAPIANSSASSNNVTIEIIDAIRIIDSCDFALLTSNFDL